MFQVTVRDGNLLKLQTELDKVQQHYTGVLDEMNIREGEVQRLNAKIRQLHSDVNDLNAQLEVKEAKVRFPYCCINVID